MENSEEKAAGREKAALRAQFRRRRLEMPEALWTRHSAAIAARLDALPEVRQAATIHAFWPLVQHREPDLRALLARWHAEGKTIVLPRVDSFYPPRLTHHVWHPDAVFARNQWGLDEPEAAWPRPATAPQVIVVPALAADRHGYRLGYGKGFYDAFLATTAAFTVVPLCAAFVVDDLPCSAHDVPVAALVTETEVLRTDRVRNPNPSVT